jgi:acyl-CoA reductase-like NAD-dependent aldehyde dehydrogenase
MTLRPPRTVDLFVSGRWQPPRAGQYEPATGCTAAERILVHERVHDAFVEALAAAVGKEVVLGDPFDPRTHLPFGGGGGSASGVGRVGGRYAMEALTQVRTVVLSGLA